MIPHRLAHVIVCRIKVLTVFFMIFMKTADGEAVLHWTSFKILLNKFFKVRLEKEAQSSLA